MRGANVQGIADCCAAHERSEATQALREPRGSEYGLEEATQALPEPRESEYGLEETTQALREPRESVYGLGEATQALRESRALPAILLSRISAGTN